MRIAWVSYDFTEYCVRQASALATNHDVLLTLAGAEGDYRPTEEVPSLEFHHFTRPRLRQPLHQLRVIRKIINRVRSFEPDVIHFQHGHLWFNFALPILRRFPLVVTIHDPRCHEGDADSRKTPQMVMDFGYRRADRVIVHGRELIDVVHREIGIPKDRIHVVPHVAIGDEAAGHEVAEDGKTVLFFGRIWEYKGLEYLIKAEPLIAREVPDVRITIAGTGEDLGRYWRMMADPARFEVHDRWVSNDERGRLFQRDAVVVLPYTAASQSGVIPIACSHGKPIVATRVGTLPEYVDDGRTGFLVPPCDERALAHAIVSLLRDPKRRREMGEAGRKKLKEEWAPDVVARATTVVYRRAIGDRLARRSPEKS